MRGTLISFLQHAIRILAVAIVALVATVLRASLTAFGRSRLSIALPTDE
jgi:hypothetical protein